MGAPERIDADVAVIGAGVAGLYAALTAAQAGARVAVISATPLAQTASYWAQGGLAAALAMDDSPQLHLQDTERAGRGLVRRSAAAVLTNEAPEMILALQREGVVFDADRYGNLSLGLEGGHSRRRIVHAGGSATGRRVARELSATLVAQPEVLVLERTRAADLWVEDGRVTGVLCEDGLAVRARGTIIAAGGAAALWRRTTNPPGSLGIGLLLAQRAGAAIADLEFVQFHPTAVTGVAGREGFLVTEAIRGEGATLHGPDGERFVDELAPRDEVSREIWEVMNRTGAPSVRLDMREVDQAGFPNVVEALRQSGLDPATQMIPVAPAAHYVMGGVVTDLHGSAGVPGLFRHGGVGWPRPPRPHPPRLEFAVGVRGVRCPCGARRTRRAGTTPGGDTSGARAHRRPHARDPGRDVARRRPRPRPRGPRAAPRRPPPPRPPRRPLRPPARRDPRIPHPPRLPRDRPEARPAPRRDPQRRASVRALALTTRNPPSRSQKRR